MFLLLLSGKLLVMLYMNVLWPYSYLVGHEGRSVGHGVFTCVLCSKVQAAICFYSSVIVGSFSCVLVGGLECGAPLDGKHGSLIRSSLVCCAFVGLSVSMFLRLSGLIIFRMSHHTLCCYYCL